MRKYGWVIIALTLCCGLAYGTDLILNLWGSSHRTLTATELNFNFDHIHKNMVGGHGPRLVNADVHPNAAISKRKINNSASTPRGFLTVDATTCAGIGATCTKTVIGGFTSATVIHSAVGIYDITFVPARPFTKNYVSLVSGNSAISTSCQSDPTVATTSLVRVFCLDATAAGAVEIDSSFSYALFDDLSLDSE